MNQPAPIIPAPAFKLTIKKDSFSGEYIARLTLAGKLISDYYSPDKDDAIQTGQSMLADEIANAAKPAPAPF